jgi:Spy/CpxP family protein refolding chaperone
VRKALAFTVAVAVSLVGATTFSRAAQQTPPAGTASLSIDDALKSFRADLQGTRADIVAKNITLTADQASKFWPMFNQYQQEQNVIMDEQLKGVQKYVDAYPNLDDATALSLLSAHLQNDSKMVALRQKYLAEFQNVVPANTAARVVQIDRRLSLASQMEIASRIPLIH